MTLWHHSRRILVASLLSSSAAIAQSAPAPAAAAPKKTERQTFSMVPRAFQADPELQMTVITEMTEAGRKLPRPSPEAPAYYVAHSGGYHALGEDKNRKGVSSDEVQRTLQRALSANGYVPASSGHSATLLIVYFWGPMTVDENDTLVEPGEMFSPSAIGNLLDRAALVGGSRFSAELARTLEFRDLATMSIPRGDSLFRSVPTSGFFASLRSSLLVQQLAGECYYVVASAYDYESSATSRKQILWRTRMTVKADGVSQVDALQPLIAAASPYFGRDMPEAEVLLKRDGRIGKVEIGELSVVEANAPLPPPPRPPPAASEKK